MTPKGQRPSFRHHPYVWKLTEDQVRDIKERLALGESGPKIAKDYNVSRYCIYSIKSGQTWGWVR